VGNPLILSVDLDEWYHCRWATGSPIARWPTVEAAFRDHYGSDRPAGEIEEPTRQLLRTFAAEGVAATFFILGEVAEWYPDLVRAIADAGHDVACHGMHHEDMTRRSREEFAESLARARGILEELSGRPVVGYRAPNLVVADWLPEVLIEQGFAYDSSVCPSRKLQGKFAGQAHAPVNPYRVDRGSLCARGNAPLVEIPIPTFPVLKWPGAVSIATRIFGWTWSRLTLDAALRTGAACYYMHPYEFAQPPRLKKPRLRERVFLRRIGPYMARALAKLLDRYRGRIVCARDYVARHFADPLGSAAAREA